MSAAWLLKTEPSAYSFERLQRDGRTVWDGVANAAALKNLRQIRQRDRLLIYHTGDERAVVGIARAASDAYPDPRAKDERAYVVDVAFVAPLPRPVSLAAIKADPKLRAWDLVRLPRLSVVPVSATQWTQVERLAG